MLILVLVLLIFNLALTAFCLNRIDKHTDEHHAEQSAHYAVVISLQNLLVSLSEYVRELSGTETRSLEEMKWLLREIRKDKDCASEVLHSIKGLRTDITNWRSAEDEEAP